MTSTQGLRRILPVLSLLLFSGCSSGPPWFEDAVEQPSWWQVWKEAKGPLFISYAGDYVWYILDTMGSGLALADYDNDGDTDIFLLSGYYIMDAFKDEAQKYGDALWRNDGGGKFTDVTAEAGFAHKGWSNGAAFGDYDGDGLLDLYIARHGSNLLYRNNGNGTFTEVGKKAGVDDPNWGAGAVWADFDGDGWLDLYVTNYARFDTDQQKGAVKWFDDGMKQFPQFFPIQDNILYHNNGDGTFTDITRESGATGSGRSLGAVATDLDDDGDLDLYVANDVGFNDLLQNDGKGHFTNIGFESGTAADEDGKFQASMGVSASDYDNDGDIDLFVTNYSGEINALYRNEGGMNFTDVSRHVGLETPRVFDSVCWGTGIHDFDLDGSPDIFVAAGHIVSNMILFYMRHFIGEEEAEIPQMRKSAYQSSSDQSKILFLGKGDGTFEEVTERTGKTFQYKRMGRGAAFADLDLDGRMDIVASNKNQPAQVLLNRIPPKGHWLELKLRGRRPNPFAVGARARIQAGGKCFTREVYAGTSYLCGDDGILHFGLGSAAAVDRIEVRWPGGRTETYPGGSADRLMTIEDRGQGNPMPQIVPASVPAADPVPAVPPAILPPAAPAGDSPGGGPGDGIGGERNG